MWWKVASDFGLYTQYWYLKTEFGRAVRAGSATKRCQYGAQLRSIELVILKRLQDCQWNP